jgi:TATA-box binding protein (TBP) (component of TFIID and TFIIIB)
MAYEFLPKKKLKIDLAKAASELEGTFNLEVSTKVLLMVKMDHVTISLFPSGKMLVRGERDEEKAREIAQKALKCLKDSIK